MTDSGPIFSHIGLYVNDMERMVRFYTTIMSFHVTDRGQLHGSTITFLSRDPYQHHQLVFVAGRTVDRTSKLLNQMSFRLGSLRELLDFVKRLPREEVSDLEPTIHGNAWSLYFRDPEGNRVEVFADSEWYIAQPIKEVLDFDLSEAEIRSRTLEFCQKQPGFRRIEDWRASMQELMSNQPSEGSENT